MISDSQNRSTCQPMLRNFALFRASRDMFCSIFLTQYVLLVPFSSLSRQGRPVTPVPEIAVAKDGELRAGEHDVRAARQRSHVLSEAASRNDAATGGAAPLGQCRSSGSSLARQRTPLPTPVVGRNTKALSLPPTLARSRLQSR